MPTFEEVENIGVVLPLLRRSVPDADVLVVDDDSPDGTAAAAEAAGRELGQIEVLRRGPKGGLGNAYRAGFQRGLDAGYDVLVQMDADLSHDPASVPVLIEAIRAGADIAVGSRYIPGGSIPNWPFYRRRLSRAGNRYATAMLRLGISDATSGFRAYTAEAVQAIGVASTQTTGYGFQIEVAHRAARAGLTVTEVPIIFADRVRGTSKMSIRIVGEALGSVTVWGLRQRLARIGMGRDRSSDLERHRGEERERDGEEQER